MTIGKTKEDSLLQDAKNRIGVISQIIPLKNKADLENRVRNVLGLYDDAKYTYVILAGTDEWDIFKTVIPKLLENANKNKILRIIPCQLSMPDEEEWFLTNIRVGMKMARHLKKAGELFGTKYKKNKRVEIYGTVPRCHSLSKKYPLDKIIKYSDITLAEYNKHGDEMSIKEFTELKNAL